MQRIGVDQVKAEEMPANRAAVFRRADWLSFGITISLVLAVYVATLTPEVTLGFSGVFSVGAMYMGIAHPPGHPVWTLYSWLFTVLVPISNIAWRMALSSALA